MYAMGAVLKYFKIGDFFLSFDSMLHFLWPIFDLRPPQMFLLYDNTTA